MSNRVMQATYRKGEQNPFIAALPAMSSKEEFYILMESRPMFPHNLSELSSEERRSMVSSLNSVFIPMDYMYAIYDSIYRAIKSTYETISMKEQICKINALFNSMDMPYSTSPNCSSILGVPGIGKTSTIRRILDKTMPQVLEHTEFAGQLFFTKQVLYLCVETPPDASIKTLCYSIIQVINDAVGADIKIINSNSASALATQIKILCLNYHVGLIVVDEIQNAVMAAKKNNQSRPLIKFLVELMNDTNVAILCVGTPQAEELFLSVDHLKRRTRGMRLLPLKPDGLFRNFLSQIWSYQYTFHNAELTDQLANKLFDLSGGVPAYIIKLLEETQTQCLLTGQSCIDIKILQKTAELLSIRVPKVYSGGTYISDFSVIDTAAGQSIPNDENATVHRLYAKKRGRKTVERDNKDLIVLEQNGLGMKSLLDCNLLEVWGC